MKLKRFDALNAAAPRVALVSVASSIVKPADTSPAITAMSAFAPRLIYSQGRSMNKETKPERRFSVIQGGGKPPEKKKQVGKQPSGKGGRGGKTRTSGKPARAPSTSKSKKVEDWKDHANNMGFEQATIAQRVYIERAARLKVIAEKKYKAWAETGFEEGKGKEYFDAEKHFGAALKAAGLNPLDEDPPDPTKGGSRLVQ